MSVRALALSHLNLFLLSSFEGPSEWNKEVSPQDKQEEAAAWWVWERLLLAETFLPAKDDLPSLPTQSLILFPSLQPLEGSSIIGTGIGTKLPICPSCVQAWCLLLSCAPLIPPRAGGVRGSV